MARAFCCASNAAFASKQLTGWLQVADAWAAPGAARMRHAAGAHTTGDWHHPSGMAWRASSCVPATSMIQIREN
eukprot:6003377-Pleurochrysis_carterae.AAC.1